MGRVINLNDNAKERTQLIRSVVLSLRELAQQTEVDDRTRDLVAYIVLALAAIMDTIEHSVAAWEKRDYWLKADRYRMEWIWAEAYSATLKKELLSDNWPAVARTIAQTTEKLQNIKLPQRHRLGTPWVGAWKMLRQLESGTSSPTSSSRSSRS